MAPLCGRGQWSSCCNVIDYLIASCSQTRHEYNNTITWDGLICWQCCKRASTLSACLIFMVEVLQKHGETTNHQGESRGLRWRNEPRREGGKEGRKEGRKERSNERCAWRRASRQDGSRKLGRIQEGKPQMNRANKSTQMNSLGKYDCISQLYILSESISLI